MLLAGFGCKGLSKEEKAATKPVSLEYWTVFDDVDQIRNLISKYTANRSYLTVTVRQLRANEIYTRFVEALAEDKGPDIISVHSRALAGFRSKLVPMPASVNDITVYTVKKKLGVETKVNMNIQPMPGVRQIENDFVQVVKKDVVHDGKIYGLPMSLDTMALYYNKDLLDRSGIAQPPKNWTELQTAVKKITKIAKDDKILQSGVALGTGNNIAGFDDLLYILFEQSKVDFSDQYGRAVFNLIPSGTSGRTPAMKVMDFYTDFANSSRDVYSWNSKMGNSLDEFIKGSVGFFFGYSYHLPVIKSRAPQLNVEILPLPQLDSSNKVNVANYWVQSVAKKSTNQNEAWGLINYLTYSKAAKEYIDNTGRPTALRAYINEQKSKTELEPFVSQILISDNWYHGRSYVAAQKALSDMLSEWLQAPPGNNTKETWHTQVLNRGAAKVNQSL